MQILLLSPVHPRSEFQLLPSRGQGAAATHDRWTDRETALYLRELRSDPSTAPIPAATEMSPTRLQDFRAPHLRCRWPPARCTLLLQPHSSLPKHRAA